jgi:hypothetical protein
MLVRVCVCNSHVYLNIYVHTYIGTCNFGSNITRLGLGHIVSISRDALKFKLSKKRQVAALSNILDYQTVPNLT